MSIDRTKPCEVVLRWVPLSNPERPEPSCDEVLLANPCDGISIAYWVGDGRFWTQPFGDGEPIQLGSFTHWAQPKGPEPADDISLNWRLWQGFQPGHRVRSIDGHVGTVEPPECGDRRVSVRFDHSPRFVSFVAASMLSHAEDEGHKPRDNGGRG